MQTINFGSALSFEETVKLIASCPEIRVHVQGEPGIGKSSMLPAIAKLAGITRWAYIDTPNLDIGDAAMPVLKHETKTTGYYPNERFQLHTGEPVLIMLDEFSKGAQPVQNMLHPLLEETNPRFGDIPFKGIVLTTGNLTTDGVGDNRKAHTIGRQTTVRMRKPTSEEWINNYAIRAGVDDAIIAWVDKNPQVFASYLDEGQAENHYIFNPRKVGNAYCSPRTLSRASHIVKRRNVIGMNATLAALIGTIGEAGARDLETFMSHQDELPKWDDIIADPKHTKTPTVAPACAMLVFGGVQRVTEETMVPFMEYLERMDPQWQATFITTLAKSEKQKVGFRSEAFKKWILANNDLL